MASSHRTRKDGASSNIISSDGTITSDSESLLGVTMAGSTSTNDELVGRICRVRGHDEAVLCTGKPVFFCFCFPWTFEYMLLRDGTSVRVLGLESSPGEQTVYRVQVLRSSTHMDDGMLGTIRGCWLVADNVTKTDSSSSSSLVASSSSSSSSSNGMNGHSGNKVRRPTNNNVPFLAAVSRSAVAAVTLPSDGSPEADLRDRISQILTHKTDSSHTHTHPHSHSHGNDAHTFVSSSSSTSTSSSSSSVSLSMMSSSLSTDGTSSLSSSSLVHGRHVRPGLPSDGSTRISPGKSESKGRSTGGGHDERVHIVVHPTGGMLPSITSNAPSFDMDHSYKTPPGSPGSRALVSSTIIPTIPLLPPPSDDVTVTLSSSSSSHHATIMVGTSVSSSTSISGSTVSNRQVDHPLHARYTATSSGGGNHMISTTMATANITTITPSSTTSINMIRATREEENKYPLMNGHSHSNGNDTNGPLSPTSAILAAIADGAPLSSISSSSSSSGHHRIVSSSDMTSVTLSSIDISSSSPPSSSIPSSLMSPTTASVMSRVGANGASFANFRLPEGDIQAADIEAIVQLIASGARDITYPLIFARLAGTKRLLSGDVLRPFLHELLNKANVQATQAAAARDAGAVGDVPREAMDVLWKLCAQIIDIRTGIDFLEINFNFGGAIKETTIKVPGTYTWVLDGKFKEDPLLVHPLNKPKYHCSDARTLVIRNQVRFKMNATGIESVRDGDLGIKQIFKFNAGLRTEHKANTVEYDSLDRPFIEVRDGKPLIVDGHYVPRRLNDWLVVNVLKKDVYIGLPDLTHI